MRKKHTKVDLKTAETFISQGQDYDQTVIGIRPKHSQATSSPTSGRGIVERANGVQKRRLVIYITPENAKVLKTVAAIEDTDMSAIVDKLLSDWSDDQAAF